jgi:antitoxin CptB
MTVQASPKIYWRCRRGMAELDIFFQSFLNSGYQGLNESEQADFEQLLTCNDTDLLEYLMGRSLPSESNLINVVAKIRQSTCSKT